MKCPYCQEELSAQDTTCPICGYVVEKTTSESEALRSNHARVAGAQSLRVPLLLVLSALLPPIGGVLLYRLRTHTPRRARGYGIAAAIGLAIYLAVGILIGLI